MTDVKIHEYLDKFLVGRPKSRKRKLKTNGNELSLDFEDGVTVLWCYDREKSEVVSEKNYYSWFDAMKHYYNYEKMNVKA